GAYCTSIPVISTPAADPPIKHADVTSAARFGSPLNSMSAAEPAPESKPTPKPWNARPIKANW
ncbi:MAG: hypothetical protein ACXWPS_17590, partial [Ktedonobacteraceae bacterium]